MVRLITMVLFASLSVSTLADGSWRLVGNQSNVYFTSIKNNEITEVHHFKTLDGMIANSGSAKLSIDLNSVETEIGIRNERMQKMLFDTANHDKAIISVDLEADKLKQLKSGVAKSMTVAGKLNLHGVELDVQIHASAIQTDQQLIVSSTKPVIVNASQFKLASGIRALQEVAGLKSIGLSVPVTFHLVFERS